MQVQWVDGQLIIINCGFNRLAVGVERQHVAEPVGQRRVAHSGDERQHPGAVGDLDFPYVGVPATPKQILQVTGFRHN